jgi:uncharacterized protein YigA (DUF484 family)
MTSPIAPITEDDIVNFLSNTPGFFERHAELLATVQMTSPHSARAVSLQERQAEMLRDKIKGLEQRIMEMVRHSNENTAIAHKVHQWTGALLQIKDPLALPQAVVQGLRDLFDVPQAAVRVWGVAAPYAHADFTRGASDDARAFASSLTMPLAGWPANRGNLPSRWPCCRCAKAPSTAPRPPLACWCWARTTHCASKPAWARTFWRAWPNWPAPR